MIYKCKHCPRQKTGQPIKLSGVKPWICPNCKQKIKEGKIPRFLRSITMGKKRWTNDGNTS